MEKIDAVRAWVPVGAQVFAIALLFWVMNTLTSGDAGSPMNPEMGKVKDNFFIIQSCALIIAVVGVLVAIFVVPYVPKKSSIPLPFSSNRSPITFSPSQLLITLMIWLMGLADVVVLMLAVIQQGGLSRSVFVPMFFLIPTVVILLEHDHIRNMKNRGSVLFFAVLLPASIGVALYAAYTVSMESMTQYNFLDVYNVNVVNISQVIGPQPLEDALFLVSLFSLIVPVAEIVIIRKYGRDDQVGNVDT